MEGKELLSKLENLLNEKYEPILVIQLLRVPPQDELQAFAKGLSEQFGYKVLVGTGIKFFYKIDAPDFKDPRNLSGGTAPIGHMM